MRNNNNKLNPVFFKLLQPLARIFLRFGISYREYCELSKAAFVAVAAEDFGVHGRPTNASRIAAMTGLTRKEIGRIRSRIERGEGPKTDRSSPVNEVLAAWRAVDEFCDERGQPKALPLKGQRGSFEALIRQFAGDIPEGAMRKELQRIDAIEQSDGRFRLNPKFEERLEADARLAAQTLVGPCEQLNLTARKLSR